MKSLERYLIFGIIVVGILLTAAGLASYRTLTGSIEAADRVANTREVLTEIEATLSTLKDAETGQRGFLIAGREIYLEPFLQADKEIDQRLERLRQLTATNSRHREKLASIEPLVRAKFNELHRTVKLRREEGFESARSVVLSNEGKEKMDALRQLFGEMKDEETADLQEQQASSASDARRVVITFVILFVLIGLLFCLMFLLIKRELAARSRLESKLVEMVKTDELTGINNRREMNRLLELEILRFQRYHTHLSFLLLDIDHFKSVNDTHGHQIGDEVLKWVAANLRESLRSVDLPARYGGEEFAVILPETKIGEALVIAERARQKIAASPFVFTENNSRPIEIPVTISIGIAELQETDSAGEVIVAADRALYRAKSEGRNRSIVFEQKVANSDSVNMKSAA